MQKFYFDFLFVLILANVSFTHASELEFFGNPDFTIVDFEKSRVSSGPCEVDSQQECFFITVDPEFITEGTFNVIISPLYDGGSLEQVGDIVELTFFNGYTGNGPFMRIDEPNQITFMVPVVNVVPPDDSLEAIDIFQLKIQDIGDPTKSSGLDVFIGAKDDLMVQREPGQPPIPVNQVKPDRELLAHNVFLDIRQEVPSPNIPVGSPEPNGRAFVSVDADTGTFNVVGKYFDMTGPVTGAHLHGPAAPGETAAVLVELGWTGGIEGIFAGEATLTDDQMRMLFSGQTYLNLHTDLNGAGEIRGQVLIPEPSGLVLLGFGILGVLTRLRQSSKPSL